MQHPNIDIGQAMAVGASHYRSIGFKSRVGFGKRPALLIIDMARAWTVPGGPFYCSEVDSAITAVAALLVQARARRTPVFYTTTAYQPGFIDAGVWLKKIPSLIQLVVGSDHCLIDERLAPVEGEPVLVKRAASAFHGTSLAANLTALRVDTVIITGVSTSGCVRHSAEDCVANGFRPIVTREAVADRVPGATAWNLFDIDAKVGDVESLESVLRALAKCAEETNA